MSAELPPVQPFDSDTDVLEKSTQLSKNDQLNGDKTDDFNEANQSATKQTSESGFDVNYDGAKASSEVTIDSSDEFSLAIDCVQIATCVSETPQTAVAEVSERDDELEELLHHSSEHHQRLGRNGESTALLESLRRIARKIKKSRFLLVIQFLLLGMAISACVMGIKYIDSCPASHMTPIFVFMTGLSGGILIVGRMTSTIVTIVTRRLGYADLRMVEPKALTVCGIYLLTIFGSAEICSLLIKSPIFNHLSKFYCNMTFYYYTLSMNALLLCVAFLAALLHILAYQPSVGVTEVVR